MRRGILRSWSWSFPVPNFFVWHLDVNKGRQKSCALCWQTLKKMEVEWDLVPQSSFLFGTQKPFRSWVGAARWFQWKRNACYWVTLTAGIHGHGSVFLSLLKLAVATFTTIIRTHADSMSHTDHTEMPENNSTSFETACYQVIYIDKVNAQWIFEATFDSKEEPWMLNLSRLLPIQLISRSISDDLSHKALVNWGFRSLTSWLQCFFSLTMFCSCATCSCRAKWRKTHRIWQKFKTKCQFSLPSPLLK